MTSRHGHVLAVPRFTQMAAEAARALDEQDWLRVYETGFVWPSGTAGVVAASFAERLLGGAARRAIAVRSRPQLAARLKISYGVDALRTLAALAQWPRIEDRLWEWDEHRFCRRVASRLPADAVAVHVYEHCALEVLERARELGVAGILHTGSLHPRASDELMEIAVSAEPVLRDTLQFALHERRGPRDQRREREYAAATIITAPSRYAAQTLAAHGVAGSKIKVIPLAAPARPAEARRQPPRTGPLRVLYAGRIGAHKGCHQLAAAWRHVAGDAHLTFVGALALPRPLLAAPRVTVRPPLDRAALFAEMRNSDVLVLPTLGDTFGLVVGEALANGIPVLVSDRAGAADLVTEGVSGWVVKAGDIEALGSRLSWLVNHPDEVRDMRRAILDGPPPRSWDDFRREFIALMGEIACAA